MPLDYGARFQNERGNNCVVILTFYYLTHRDLFYQVCYRGRCDDKFNICPTSSSSSTTPESSTTSTTTTRSPVPCNCCWYRKKYKRQRCCRIGRQTFNFASCYCCRELKGVKPPTDFEGPRF